ncbi:MAG: hypothetical protein WCD38_11785 [Candidatus Tumulicola sp.]
MIALILLALATAAPVPQPAKAPPYVPAPCSSLQESVPKVTSPAMFYGELLGEALRRHGFDAAYPHIDRTVLSKAEMDWAMCFTANAPSAAPAKKK